MRGVIRNTPALSSEERGALIQKMGYTQQKVRLDKFLWSGASYHRE
jgi:hypothetical protein